MDALSELLRVIKLDSAVYINAEFSEPWCIASPQARLLAPVLAQGTSHLIIYHLLSEGRAYVEMQDSERVPLRAGDLVSFPHGDPHLLGNGSHVVPVDVGAELPAVLGHGLAPLQMGGGGSPTRFICGFLACDAQMSAAFLGGLPRLLHINIRDDAAGQWLENTLQFSVEQAAKGEAGSGAMITKLSEVLFAETLRRYVRSLPDEQIGWFAGARDPSVGKVLTLLHHEPARVWTLPELAQQAGLSRTVLAERFRHFLGESPIAYLTRWRMRLGARALTTTNLSVARIAAEVGYESEAAFNRAFKREYGEPPARYRKTR